MPKVIDKSFLTKKSQITLPKKVRDLLKLKPGDQVNFEVEGNVVRIIPMPSRIEDNFGKVTPRKKPENFAEIRKDMEEKIGVEVAGEF
ncbi:MAG: AbrB/MazE/SpoVT family DNA-binding domain-containing protein [Candidatus Atribacteria bacterium]|jgi:AbrB family looped-hinge helix DNA binding protein|nr:AbrB/MazE/SpoVT family DNA-binding domain-containing protein [Candidatus Atribacteria bacterium]